MSVIGKIGQRLFLMRHRRRLGWYLLLAVITCVAGGIMLAPRIPWFRAHDLVYCHLPSAVGLRPGEAVIAPTGERLGTLSELRPEGEGMLVIVRLDRGVTLKNGSVLVCKAKPEAHRTTLTISSPATGHDLSFPVSLAGEIVPGAPDGYLEPLPRWPATRR